MNPSKTGILAEQVKRSSAGRQYNKVSLTAGFGPQNAFVMDESRYLVAQCSRRAGKSNSLALRFFRTMEKHPKTDSLYVGITQESARDIMWPVFKEMNDKYQLGCKFNDQRLVMKHPNGATVKLVGADRKDFLKKLRGKKHPGVAIDEAQDLTTLQPLVDDVLTACIADYEDGWLALTGTPGPVPQGYFYDVSELRKYGYAIHKWTLLDNPYMPKPQAFISDLITRREWKSDNPTLRREWYNEWVKDADSLWIRYDVATNDYIAMPPETQHKWNYVMGVDIGFKDADALAVLAWSETSPNTYLVEELVASKQKISTLVEQIDMLQKKYNVYKIVMDEGGLGKKIGEDIRQRFGCPLHPADKAHKQDNVTFLNDHLRLGKFKAKRDSKFAQDADIVQIDWDKSTPQRIVLKKSYHSDIIDAVLYAFRESYAYTHSVAESNQPRYGSKEWADTQEDHMFTATLEGLQQAEEHSKWLNGEWSDVKS